MVKVGQVYRDKDKRMYSGKRYLLVTYLHTVGDKADTVQCDVNGRRFESARVYKISRKNLEKRFELVATA